MVHHKHTLITFISLLDHPTVQKPTYAPVRLIGTGAVLGRSGKQRVVGHQLGIVV